MFSRVRLRPRSLSFHSTARLWIWWAQSVFILLICGPQSGGGFPWQRPKVLPLRPQAAARAAITRQPAANSPLWKLASLVASVSAVVLGAGLMQARAKNSDLVAEIGPVAISAETHDLFERHKLRFKTGIPNSIYDFVSHDTASSPTELFQLNVCHDGRLVAASYFDVGEISISSIYAIFDPNETSRSLGIFTMLKEIEYAAANGKSLYYHGYAYEGESYYDYKKRFSALEQFDWKGTWTALEKLKVKTSVCF